VTDGQGEADGDGFFVPECGACRALAMLIASPVAAEAAACGPATRPRTVLLTDDAALVDGLGVVAEPGPGVPDSLVLGDGPVVVTGGELVAGAVGVVLAVEVGDELDEVLGDGLGEVDWPGETQRDDEAEPLPP
jgi:hypothetical protein